MHVEQAAFGDSLGVIEQRGRLEAGGAPVLVALRGQLGRIEVRVDDVVLPTGKEHRRTRVALSAGPAAQLVVESLGAMTAAQLFDAAKRADAEIVPSIGKGDFAPLMAWLRKNVHEQGSHLDTDALLVAATGKTLDAEIFKAHLKARYLDA